MTLYSPILIFICIYGIFGILATKKNSLNANTDFTKVLF